MASQQEYVPKQHKGKGYKAIFVQLPSGLFQGVVYRQEEAIAYTQKPVALETLRQWTDAYIGREVEKDATSPAKQS